MRSQCSELYVLLSVLILISEGTVRLDEDDQFEVDQRQEQDSTPTRSQLGDMEDVYVSSAQNEGAFDQQVASSNKNEDSVDTISSLAAEDSVDSISSLDVAKMLLEKEREKVKDLEEYVRLADSNNRKLASLEEQHSEEVVQYRNSNEQMRAELASLRERCKNEIEQVFEGGSQESGEEFSLAQVSGHVSCANFSKNGAGPVVDARSCENACWKAAEIECADAGCYYKQRDGRANSSKCDCPIRVRVHGALKVREEHHLCQDLGYSFAARNGLSLLVGVGMLYMF